MKANTGITPNLALAKSVSRLFFTIRNINLIFHIFSNHKHKYDLNFFPIFGLFILFFDRKKKFEIATVIVRSLNFLEFFDFFPI